MAICKAIYKYNCKVLLTRNVRDVSSDSNKGNEKTSVQATLTIIVIGYIQPILSND